MGRSFETSVRSFHLLIKTFKDSIVSAHTRQVTKQDLVSTHTEAMAKKDKEPVHENVVQKGLRSLRKGLDERQ